MQVAFKGWKQAVCSERELLSGGERMAGQWENQQVAHRGWRGLQGVGLRGLEELRLSSLQAGSLRKLGCADGPSRAAGLIFEAACLGTGSRFSSGESSSFKVQLKCHLLGKDSSGPRHKINRPPVLPWCLQDSLITSTRCVCLRVSPSSRQDFSGQVPCHTPVSLCLGGAVHTVGAQ